MQQFLKTAKIKHQSKVLGPGKRFVIWFYGCSRNCPGCIAYSMNRSGVFSQYTPEELAAEVAGAGVDGVTLSGGEPLEQDPVALTRFLMLVKDLGKNVICFTGMNYDTIKNNEKFSGIFKYTDLLIDGEYLENQDNGTYLRGSDNQRFILLSDFFSGLIPEFTGKYDRQLEIELDQNNILDITGIPKRGFMQKLQKNLNDNGLMMI